MGVSGEQGFLALFATRVFLDKDGLECEGVEFGVVHQGGVGGGSGGEDLHLLGVEAQLLADEAFEALHVSLGTAGVSGNEVVGEELALAGGLRAAVKLLFEAQQGGWAGLTHVGKYGLVAVFGGELHLAGDVVVDEVIYVSGGVLWIGQEQVGADAGGDEDLLDAGQATQRLEQVELGAVVDRQEGAGVGVEAALMRAGAGFELVGALEAVHIGGRAAEVVDDALELGVAGELFGLGEDGAGAAR